MCTYLYTKRSEQQCSTNALLLTYAVLSLSSTDSCVCLLDEGQEKILFAVLFNYTREEFNLVEWEECTCIERKRKEWVLIAARGREHTRVVCMCMCIVRACVISYIRLLICRGDRIRQKAFPASNPNSLISHTRRSQIINYQRHTLNKKKHFRLHILL